MFQIAIATSGAIIAVFHDFDKLYYSPILSIGVILLLTGISMRKINLGIVSNGNALREVGRDLGDEEIPLPQFNAKSVAWWISWLMIVGGVVIIISWAYLLIASLCGDMEVRK